MLSRVPSFCRPARIELRGTGPRIWRGLAPGSNKDAGYFWSGPKGFRLIVLCESAIDADEPGDRMSTAKQHLYPSIYRLRPWLHDWNDVLLATRTQQDITTP